jgi:Flp pilus assembly protein TadG
MNRIQRLRRDESGMSFVFVGLSLMAFLSASMLAIDVGMLMTARNQAQNSADSGALAGATALIFDDFNNRSASGPAVTSALSGARSNSVMRQTVSVGPADVTFPNDPAGNPNRVRVTVYRQAARGNAVATLIAQVFGVTSADIVATATAEASPASAATCIKPFTIPDRWIERQTPPWDTGDTFSAYPKNPSLQPDVYHPVGDPAYTGYDAFRDKGMLLVIKAGTGNNISPSFYYPWDIPGSVGASDYEWNIENCNTTAMEPNVLITAEPGNMVGPTRAGVENLVARDPGAYWNTSTNKVVSDMHPSPRVVIIPVFDPYYYDTGKHNGRNADLKAVNYIGFFIEGIAGNGDVTARITPVSGLRRGGGGGGFPNGFFPKAIRLVQ